MPDPLTLLTIFGTGAALNLATRAKPIVEERQPYMEIWASTPPATEIPLLEGRQPITFGPSLPTQQVGATRLERTIAALKQFAMAPAGGDSRPAQEALLFLGSIPQYLPAALAVESDDGLITLFWDTPDLYADVEFHGDGKFSVFTRSRGTKEDAVLEGHPIEQASGGWLSKYLSPLLPKLEKKAA